MLTVNANYRLIIFGGKGGCGKTTSAAATALYLSKALPQRKILVMSVDPAHSLADSFDIPAVSNLPVPVKSNLWSLEINAADLLEDYKARYGSIMKEITGRATYFDKQDIDEFFSLSLPGLDEIMAIVRIADLLKSAEYDLVILDTAPTAHTRVLLSLPRQMAQWIDLMDMLMNKHRYIVKAMTGKYKEDACDNFIGSQRDDVRRVQALLTNRDTTEFVAVTIPEPLSIDEVERLVGLLNKDAVPVHSLIVNRVVQSGKCPICSASGQAQQANLDEIRKRFKALNLIMVPLFPYEIRGEQRLIEYARALFEESRYQATTPLRSLNAVHSDDNDNAEGLVLRGSKLIIFGGKGGVGKSVIAAASGLHMANSRPDLKVLIFSADPAHSLSDVFGVSIGDKITAIEGLDNLDAIEIDGATLLESLKLELKNDIEDAFDRFLGQGMDMAFDRQIFQELFTMTPPGLDELMALSKILDLFNAGVYDLIILDSPASGHLVRLLELPHLVREWLNQAFHILIKYKGLGSGRFHDASARLVKLSREIREIIKTLNDPGMTEFVMITIPEAMAVAEAQHLAASLESLRIPSSNIIVNMVVPPVECPFCSSREAEQKKYIARIHTIFAGHNIVSIPLFTRPVNNREALDMLAQSLYRKNKPGVFLEPIGKL